MHYQHQDWLGTERARTNASGAVEGTYQSLPFGDGFSSSGSDNDAYHFALLDRDTDDTHHAQFRQYSSTQGRWMSPDPYDGSYDGTDPQSFNRYAYVGNMPLGLVDPLGLGGCDNKGYSNGSADYCGGDAGLGSRCTLDGLPTPCGDALGAVNNGFACLGSCSTSVEVGGRKYTIVQTANAPDVSAPNGELLSSSSIKELGLQGYVNGLSRLYFPSFASAASGGTPSNTVSATGRGTKSPARQACEQKAQQKLQSATSSFNSGFWGGLKTGVQEGSVGGAMTGAIGGCVVTSEIGCVEGTVGGAVIGGLSGGVVGGYHFLMNNAAAYRAAQQQFSNDMAACSYIP
ncbi:MAG: hypothetical protein JST61_08075 [Acidobacteria bacterium]|nr:hypothetical protein [Acidobacteriota bacterium]